MALLALLFAVAVGARPIDPSTWISSSDYPAEAVKNGAAGTVRFRLRVAPGGEPNACDIVESSGWNILDSATCRLLLARARFAPFEHEEGNRSYQSAVTWQRPPVRPSRSVPVAAASMDYPPDALLHHWEGLVGFELDIDPAGRAVACRVTQTSGHEPLDDATCKLMTNRARFSPPRDAAGKPVSGQYHNQIVWKLPR